MISFDEIYKLTKNANLIVTGGAGSGKTLFSKLTALTDAAERKKILVIDEFEEYKSLANILLGNYIDLNTNIVPFEKISLLGHELCIIVPERSAELFLDSDEDACLRKNTLRKILNRALDNDFTKIYLGGTYSKILLNYYTEFSQYFNKINFVMQVQNTSDSDYTKLPYIDFLLKCGIQQRGTYELYELKSKNTFTSIMEIPNGVTKIL